MKINKKNIKIAHLSFDLSAGAGVYITRFHKFLRRKKIVSKIFTNSKIKGSNIETIISHNFFLRLYFFFVKKINFFFLRNKNKYSFYFKWFYLINHLKELDAIYKFRPNFLIIYNNNSFINYNLILKLQKKLNLKIIIYPLDMEPITGGCHYFWDCQNFKKGCIKCPAVISPLQNQVKKNMQIKTDFYKKSNLGLISGTKTLSKIIKGSSIWQNKKNLLTLYSGIDKKKFYPRTIYDKKFNVLYRSSFNLRKGEHILKETLLKLSNDSQFKSKMNFIVIGSSSINDFLQKNNFNYKYLGAPQNDKDLSNVYRQSDFFLNTSIQDGGPMMINEAIMCNLPVISFPTQLANETINKSNGFLIKSNYSQNLSKVLKKISKLNRYQVNQMKNNINKSLFKKEFDREYQFKKFFSFLKAL